MSKSKTLLKYVLYLIKYATCKFLETIAFLVSLLFPPIRSSIPPIKDKILSLSAFKISQEIKKGQLTSEQVVRSYIRRIEKVNPIINAVVDKRYEKAIIEAREVDRKLKNAREGVGDKSILELPLVGVPLTVKETIALEGSVYTAGLARRRFKRASRSNQAVANLVQAGLIPIASTNIPCMNLWWDSANLVYGRSKNPYDLSRIVGGSSGGEAAILAAAGSVIGIGSDLAGSIRIPCNFCGVFGHKPTPFSVSNDGVFPKMRKEQEKLRGVGPMTRYAIDLKPMLKIMLKNEEELSKMRLDEPVDLKQIKIYYCENLGDPLVSRCNSDILAGLRATVEHFSSTYRVKVERVKLDEFKYGLFLWSAEMNVKGGNVYDKDHEDGLVSFNPLVELCKKFFNSSEFPFNSIITKIIEFFAPKYGSAKHLHLTQKATCLRQRFLDLIGDNGILMMPAHPQPAPHHYTTLFKFFNVAYTAVGNTLQAPITQCPLGMTKEGLPYGLQLISKPYNDRLNLAVACELERVFGGWQSPSRFSS